MIAFPYCSVQILIAIIFSFINNFVDDEALNSVSPRGHLILRFNLGLCTSRKLGYTLSARHELSLKILQGWLVAKDETDKYLWHNNNI